MHLSDKQLELLSSIAPYVSRTVASPAASDPATGPPSDEIKYVYQDSVNSIINEFKASLIQDREERKSYATKIYWTLVCSLLVTGTIIILDGLEILKIEGSIILALISFNSLGLIGLFLSVTNYLFKKK